MAALPYYGSYCTFTASGKDVGALIIGADTLIGDEYKIEFEFESGKRTAWIANRFGARLGYLSTEESERIAVMQAKGWTVKALLASVLFTEEKPGGYYWGDIVVMGYDAKYAESFDVFTQEISRMLANGVRPSVDLAESGVKAVLQAKGNWKPSGREQKIAADMNTALVKDRRSVNEKLIELSRERHPGCMAVGWIFILALIIGALFIMKLILGI